MAGFATRGNRIGIYFCPQHRPAVVRLHRVRAVEQPDIGWQILAEISHPAR